MCFVPQSDYPLEAFCEQLLNDLFHMAWEIRHGAAIGLREVMLCYGKKAGLSAARPNHQLPFVNHLWLEDVTIRLICVLALDRFGDFVSDEVRTCFLGSVDKL